MSNLPSGWLTLLLLAAAVPLSPLPRAPVEALLLGLAALWLETGGVRLDEDGAYRFSPAVPAYLAMAMVPGVGAAVAAGVLVLDAIYRMEAGFWPNLAQRLPLAVALLVTAGASSAWPDAPLFAIAPVTYLAARWKGAAGRHRPPTDPAQKLVWRQLQLRIRPLELSLAAISPLLAAGIGLSPWLAVAAMPLLACTHLAAENVLLTASDATVARVLEQLKGARAQARKAALQRDRALQEKELLEGFSRLLAGQPTLEAAAASLVATVHKLMPADNIVVFLGSPPEPFSYQATPEHQEALQAAALTALREPLVDRAHEQKRPVLQKAAPNVSERLLRKDNVAAALPLGTAGVLYVGREGQQAFAPGELDRLKWLAQKATLALEAAFLAHAEAVQRRRQEQAVDRLERQVAWLSRLVQGAEAMASSLQTDVLVQRLAAVVKKTVPHQAGLLLLQGQPPTGWGAELRPNPELLEAARASGRSLALEDVATSRFGSPAPGLASVVVTPLLAGSESLGSLILGSERKAAFSGEQMDLLFLLCSQAAMALSHAALYSEVVEARRQLEESQASLVQSSKLTAIGQLAAEVAHELNSPMGAISLSVDESLNLLEQRPELARKLLGKAQVAVERARAFIDRLLAFSRLPESHRKVLSLRDLVRDTVEFLDFQLRTYGVTASLQGEDPGWVEGEEQGLQQVVTNLLLNGAQAMKDVPASQRALEFRLRRVGETVCLAVTDRGTGIAEADQARIFEPFFTTKPVGSGTGLGLWACQQIVLGHGGTIRLESQVGQGSTFHVSLPAAPVRTP